MSNFIFSKTNEFLIPSLGDRPIDFFRMLVDDDFLNLLVEQTNIYAEEVYLSTGVHEHARISRWKTLLKPELLTFLGLVLHTGTIKLNKLHDY